MAYLFLALSIILEVCGTICMKLSDGFSKPLPVVGTCLTYIACFYFLSLSLKTIPLGIVYAVWAGLGLGLQLSSLSNTLTLLLASALLSS